MSSMATGVEVSGLIDGRPLGWLQIRVAILCAFVVFIEGYDIQVMALAVPSVAETWGVRPSTFSWALSASLLGMVIGAGIVAPWGDRIGRRPIVVAGMLACGAATLATALSRSPTDFVIWRFLTGAAIGGTLANAAALTSEYMPQRKRTWLFTAMYCCLPLGAFCAGLLAPAVLRASDWRGLFILGGLGTAAVGLAAAAGLPESLKFLLGRRPGHAGIARTARRLAPEVDPATLYIATAPIERSSPLELASPRYRGRTALLWSIYILNIFVIYMLTSWLPTLLRQNGWPSDQALVGGTLFQLGAVPGGLVLAWMVDKGLMRPALIAGFCAAAAGLLALVLTPSSFPVWGPFMLLIGAGASGNMSIIIALSAEFYPTPLRATGVGWAVTAGRIGAVAAPLIGGVMVQHMTTVNALAVLIAPALACALLTLTARREWRDN